MDTPWDRLVIPKLDRLVGLMTPKCFLDKILARGLITRPEYIIIKSKTAPEQVRHLLIELLPTRPTTAYEEFRQVLQETPEQRHLLDVYFPPEQICNSHSLMGLLELPDEGISEALVVPLRKSNVATATDVTAQVKAENGDMPQTDQHEETSVVAPLSADAPSVIRAVVTHGADQYFSIGRELGLNAAQINATVASIPSSAGKLRAVIERRKAAIGDERLVRELLAVCGRLPTPIQGNVRRQLIG